MNQKNIGNLLIVLVIFSSLMVGFNDNLTLKIESYSPILSTRYQVEDTLNVVASISIVADFTNNLGEGMFTATSIVEGNENPHIYEPTPEEVETVANADLFVRMGLGGLEPWVENILKANPELNVLTIFNDSMMEYDPIIDKKNPHVWMDPEIAKTMVQNIYTELIVLDPLNTDQYQVNREVYLGELDDLLGRIDEAKNQFQGLKVVVHHPSFKYLFDLLGIERIASIEQADGSEPSAEEIANLITKIQTENVDLIVNQPQLDDDLVHQIARDTSIQIVELTPLLGIRDIEGYVLEKGARLEHYISMIDYNLEALLHPYDPPVTTINWYWWVLIGVGGIGIIGLGTTVIAVRIRKD
ncbi:MAG: hypothetical protein GF308_15245 [Candidatus Heimdallarchaeota archaeon]|nr:hypothetical protein [Candidatus Heimdallarchaeota archaeon]